MKVKRFFFVKAPHSPVVHRLYNSRVEGSAVMCGIRMSKGWMWSAVSTGRRKICKRCRAQETK